MKRLLTLALCLCLVAAPMNAVAKGVFSPNENYEYLVGATLWQLSAEARALMLQAFQAARGNVAQMALNCLDPAQPDWALETGADGGKRMLYKGKRVAVIADIDDTLVDGARYTANIVGVNGDVNNVAFARFVTSDGLTALPGAVDFVRYCADNGVAFYYVTNRSDQGYKIGQSDGVSSYEAAVGERGKGLYVGRDGEEIGASICQSLGKSFYDITLESMARLGFPIDDQHLIVNDGKLNGDSKEAARAAVREGATGYPNGQREENATGSARTLDCEAHYVAMLLGDNLGDFTDDFSGKDLTAVTRAELADQYADQWGAEWIVLPNAVYGASHSYALQYGITELFGHYSYIQP